MRITIVTLIILALGFGLYTQTNSNSLKMQPGQLEARVQAYRNNGFAKASPQIVQDRYKVTEIDYNLMLVDLQLAKARAQQSSNSQCTGRSGLTQRWYAISNRRQDWKEKPQFLNSHMTQNSGGDWQYDDALLSFPAEQCQASAKEVVSNFLKQRRL